MDWWCAIDVRNSSFVIDEVEMKKLGQFSALNPRPQALNIRTYLHLHHHLLINLVDVYRPTMASTARRLPPNFLDPTHQRGLTSLLSQTYGKPVQLNLTPLSRPYQDPDILAQVVTEKLRDRKNAPRRIIRDAAWKAGLPSQASIIQKQQELQTRRAATKPLTLAGLMHGGVTPVSDVVRDLALSQVSSVRVQAGGRLSKRITANMASKKIAMRGATKKGPTHMLRGAVKANTANAIRAGKRRIGSYGVRISLGYS